MRNYLFPMVMPLFALLMRPVTTTPLRRPAPNLKLRKERKSHLTYWQRLLIFLNLQQGSASQFFLVQMNVFIIVIVSFLVRLLIMWCIIVSIITWPWRIVRRGWSLICWRIVTWFVTWLITRLVTGFRRRRTIMIIVIVNMNYFSSVMPFGWSSI